MEKTKATGSLTSKMTLKLKAMLVVNAIILVSVCICGVFLLAYAIKLSNMVLLFISLIVLWFSIGLSALILDGIKKVELSSTHITIRTPFTTYRVKNELSSYNDEQFYSVYSSKEGLILRVNKSTAITIMAGEYSNATELIEQIKRAGQKDTTIVKMVWNWKLKLFIFTGVFLLFLLLLIVV